MSEIGVAVVSWRWELTMPDQDWWELVAVGMSNVSGKELVSMDAKLAALMDKKELAPLESSSIPLVVIAGGPVNWPKGTVASVGTLE